ncbi:hypothetical protein L202_02242 [Cryptococcus amylolentus CBS 6039]|uniref:Uncharacterized protein n=2 Tax=Cryptococcus amylolentus TaxID=104669 RepID=A0A1E3HZT3_9TREE|nr:hypothetical protein L202_02242 [Cryptococcus amylolentus CBS 6039]ODN81893.1 hypothetical protein L202_02242 [Cryptococcus amylolentus CBS 6039]ODO09951.1 hypothetical protein I350_02174 [Cryptococcus amylolentus CBS 6273]
MGIVASFLHFWQHFVTHSGTPIVFWTRPNWSVDQIPDQSGKVVLITGGNSGVGYASALALYNAGANVTIACRSFARGQEAAEDIKKNGDRGIWGVRYNQRTPAEETKLGSIDVLALDLTDLASVEQAADKYKLRVKRLDQLYLNAGIMAVQEGQWTKQNYTLQFGSMVLGHQRLTTHLLPILLSPREEPARVISLSSVGHNFAPPGGIDYTSVSRHPDDVANPDGSPKKGKNELDRWPEYGQAKWGNIAIAKYLADRYDPKELIAVAVHPGSIATNLGNHIGIVGWAASKAHWALAPMTFSPYQGALNQLWSGTLPATQALELNGKYVVPFRHVMDPRADLLGEEGKERARKLWAWCDEQGKKFE